MARPTRRFEGTSVIGYPEVLRLGDSDGPASTTDQIVDATKKAVDHPDVQTIFFVGFVPRDVNAEDSQTLRETVDLLQSWQAWGSAVCEGYVQRKVHDKSLPGDSDGQFARSTYRAKIFDYLLRQSTWFAKTIDQNTMKRIEVPQVDFHAAIFKAVLSDFAVPQWALPQLEKILTTIGDNIIASSTKSPDKQQYWVMLTRYEWQDMIKETRLVVRVISFSVDPRMSKYVVGKSSYTSVSINLQFVQYQADFVERIYKKVRNSIDDRLVTAGMDLVKSKSIEVII